MHFLSVNFPMDWYLTDSKSRITRENHTVKKPREFHDNESENISGESELLCRCGTIYNVQSISMSLSGWGAYLRAALINFFVPDAALIRGRRLIEGGAYSSKYGNREWLVITTSFARVTLLPKIAVISPAPLPAKNPTHSEAPHRIYCQNISDCLRKWV